MHWVRNDWPQGTCTASEMTGLSGFALGQKCLVSVDVHWVRNDWALASVDVHWVRNDWPQWKCTGSEMTGLSGRALGQK